MSSEPDIDVSLASIMRVLEEPLARAADRVLSGQVEEVKIDLSVPVEFDAEGNAIRSAPGEPPRLEFDHLRDNVQHTVSVEGDVPEGEMYAFRPPEGGNVVPHLSNAAIVLEIGGGPTTLGDIEPRPFMGPAAERMQQDAAAITAETLREDLS